MITTMVDMSSYYVEPLYNPGTMECNPVQRMLVDTACRTQVNNRWITPQTLTGGKLTWPHISPTSSQDHSHHVKQEAHHDCSSQWEHQL